MSIWTIIKRYTLLARLLAAVSGSKTAQRVVERVAPIADAIVEAGEAPGGEDAEQ